MATLVISTVTTNSVSAYIDGLEHPWVSTPPTGYEQAYITVSTVGTSPPVYPPASGTNYFTSIITKTGLSPGTNYTVTGFVVYGGSTVNVGSTGITTGSVPSALTGLHATAITANSISVAWNASSGATTYEVYKNNVYQTNTSGTSYTFGSLAPGTLYRLGAIPKNSWGSGSGANIDVSTTGTRPGNFNWTYAGLHPTTGAIVTGPLKLQGYGFYCTAKEWNDFCDRINEFRVNHKGMFAATFTSATTGLQPTKAQYDEVRSAISAMGVSVPGSPSVGSSITADHFNDIVSSLNSVT